MNKYIKTSIIVVMIIVCSMHTQAYPDNIDAEIILPTYTPPKVYTTPAKIDPIPDPLSSLEILENFLIGDTTDHHEYIASGDDMYICVHFATDLAQNLTDARYETGIVVRSAKYHNRGRGHLLTWCKIENDLFVI